MTHDHAPAPDLVDWDSRGEYLERGAELDLDWIEPALRWIRDEGVQRPVERILDLGSGPGVVTTALAAAFPTATVTAVDGSAPLLARAADRAARLDVAGRVATQRLDLGAPDGWAALPDADLAWISRVLHHLPDPPGAAAAIRERLRRGGLLVVVEGGLPVRWGPDDLGVGRPGLQPRLDVVVTEGLAALPPPHTVHLGLDWPGLLRAAGFAEVRTRSWLQDVPAPVPPAVRDRIRDQLDLGRRGFADRLDDDDRAALDRLLDPDDPNGVARRPDLFWLTAHTLHVARA